MGDKTSIEWTNNTFNPWWGCAKVSPGCDHCYAERDAHFHSPAMTLWGVDADRRQFGDKHWNQPRIWNRRAQRAGKRELVFCASMADVFDKNAPKGARDRLWALIAETPHLDWQILTKRIGNVPRMLPKDWGSGWAHVWLGISVVNQEEADRDIPKLLAIPARLRFLSCEPLLGPIELGSAIIDRGTNPIIDWVIAGGESGPNARPVHPDWLRSLRDQCTGANVPFLFKQWGEYAPTVLANDDDPGTPWRRYPDGSVAWGLRESMQDPTTWPKELMNRLGKKAAGRELDGRTYDAFPA